LIGWVTVSFSRRTLLHGVINHFTFVERIQRIKDSEPNGCKHFPNLMCSSFLH